MKLIYLITILSIFSLSCSKNLLKDNDDLSGSVSETGVLAVGKTSKNVNREGVISAYFEKKLISLSFKTFSEQAARNLLDANKSINVIYTSDSPLLIAGNSKRMFVSVVDAITSSGINDIWLEEQVSFNPGFTPHQFFSDDQIDAAAFRPQS